MSTHQRARIRLSAVCLLPLWLAAAAGASDAASEREACANRVETRQPLFGETHTHTAYSFDAASQDTRNTPRDAYRFARGAEVGLQPYDAAGKGMRTARLDRPLDFTMVSDHAEMLGEVRSCKEAGQPGYDSDACWFFRSSGELGMMFAFRTLIGRDRFNFCGENGELCLEAAELAWKDIQSAAEEAYDRSDACGFTSFVGYEWTASIGGGINLHRNVLFRNAQVPSMPLSWVETPSAHDLWLGLQRDCVEAGTGCDVLSIPHNSNISGDGLMFVSGKLEDMSGADIPIDVEDARLRQRFEPLAEIMQHKGDSECLLGGDTVDEACAFEKLDYDSFAGVRRIGGPAPVNVNPPKRSAMVREALKKGLSEEEKLGVNPFKYGIIASTDTHLGTPGLAMEYASKGHGGAGMNSSTALPIGLPDNIEFNPGGLAVVWAEENSRNAIFDAMMRRETYGTSGTRPTLRFFGGWDYPETLCDADDLAAQGYAGGVPMGGDLSAPAGDAPVFVVSAMRDAGTAKRPGMPLDRIQIVKGWIEDGETHEKVIDVSGGKGSGRVDTATCETSGRGADQLCAVWQDEDFDASQRAFYYARVLENPSCRWSQHLCVQAGVRCGDPETVGPGYGPCCEESHRPVVQERAWSSPIWFRPDAAAPMT